MLLHAKNISMFFDRVVIHTPDTDVVLIALGVSGDLRCELFVKTGVQNKVRIISLAEMKQSLIVKYTIDDINVASKALLGLHAFTGCDTISAFSGKGKVKPTQVMMKSKDHVK